jgi:hypothetical protein
LPATGRRDGDSPPASHSDYQRNGDSSSHGAIATGGSDHGEANQPSAADAAADRHADHHRHANCLAHTVTNDRAGGQELP